MTLGAEWKLFIYGREYNYSLNVIHSPHAIRCSRTTCNAFSETDLTSKLFYRRDDLQLEKYARFSERLPGISLQKAVRTMLHETSSPAWTTAWKFHTRVVRFWKCVTSVFEWTYRNVWWAGGLRPFPCALSYSRFESFNFFDTATM